MKKYDLNFKLIDALIIDITDEDYKMFSDDK